MFDEDLKALWKRGEATMPPLAPVAIENLLRPTARRSGRSLEFLAWTHVAMLAFTALLAFVNVYGYRDNPTMLAVEAALAAVSVSFTLLGARLIAGLRRIARADLPLVQMVEQRLSFTERWYQPWILLGTVTPWLLVLAINTDADNQQGHYTINHPWEFAIVTAVMLAITYASLKLSTGTTVRELRAVLHDLRAEAIDATPLLADMRRRSRRWMAVGVVLLSLAVLLGVALWLKLL